MSTAKTETVKTTISAYWAESEKEINEAARAKRLKALQREGEISVADLENAADAADTELENSIRGALTGSVTMATLFEKKRAAKIARAKHTDALANYEEFFGEKPRLQ